MADQLGLVKNPLGVIALFAGLAEVTATVALPQLAAPVQGLFVWFVMLFPVMLVLLFFLVLWVKPQVFYAPSDYRDEGNFMRHFVPGPAPVPVAAATAPATEGVLPPLGETDHEADAVLARELVLRRLSAQMDVGFMRDAELRGGRGLRFDGLAQGAAGPVLVRAGMVGSIAEARELIRSALRDAERLGQAIPSSDLRGGLLIIAPVLRGPISEADRNDLRLFLGNRRAELDLPLSIALKAQSLDELKKGWGA